MSQKQPELVVKERSVIQGLISDLADWLNTHWVIKTILQFLPSIWSPIIITGFGTTLRLKNQDGLTTFGIISAITLYLIALLVSIIAGFKAKRDTEKNRIWSSKEDEYKSAIGLLNTLFDSEHTYEKSITQHALENSKDIIWNQEDCLKLQKLFSAEYCMREIKKQIKSCFFQITKLNIRDLFISSLVSLDGINWEWIDREDVYSGLEIDELIQEGTTFHEVSSGRTTFAYANDKACAADGSTPYRYKYDKKDLESKTKGSIICWQVTIGNGHKVIAQMIINISTYNKKFADGLEDPQEIEMLYNNTIRNHILKHFEGEIQLALVSYYLASKS